MSEDIKREETLPAAETPLDEKALEAAAGGSQKYPQVRQPRVYENRDG